MRCKELSLFVGINESDELKELGRVAKEGGAKTARSWDKLIDEVWRERPDIV